MDPARYNLDRYLKTEALLNTFFAAFDHCLARCIRPEPANNNRPTAACCKDKYHSMFDLPHPAYRLLRLERVRLYGPPRKQPKADSVSPCEYHDPMRGCLLASCKSPICLAFLCRPAIDRLRAEYNIYTYDFLGVNYALEWILTGDFSDRQYAEFNAGIAAMIAAIQP